MRDIWEIAVEEPETTCNQVDVKFISMQYERVGSISSHSGTNSDLLWGGISATFQHVSDVACSCFLEFVSCDVLSHPSFFV